MPIPVKTLALLALGILACPVFAEERILADDGREVLLKDDGSWEYISQDRLATTASGERVRLKDDGSWEIVTDAKHTAPAGGVVLTDTGPAHWALQDVIIETARSQRGGSKKGVSKQTHTVFTLQVRRKPGIQRSLQWAIRQGAITVTDSGGRQYPVLSVQPSTMELNSDQAQQLVVRADGSPHWFTTQYFELTIAEGTVDNDDDIRLKRALSNVLKREVDALPQ